VERCSEKGKNEGREKKNRKERNKAYGKQIRRGKGYNREKDFMKRRRQAFK